MCFCGISHSNLINNRLHVGARARPHRFARPSSVYAYTGRPGGAAPSVCMCVYVCVRVWARRNIGRAHCDESVLIITLVRGTSRDAFADTYDKLSVYQQISFPNPAIFPLVYPCPTGESPTARLANVAVFPSFRVYIHTCVYIYPVAVRGLSRAQECDDSGRESVFTQ